MSCAHRAEPNRHCRNEMLRFWPWNAFHAGKRIILLRWTCSPQREAAARGHCAERRREAAAPGHRAERRRGARLVCAARAAWPGGSRQPSPTRRWLSICWLIACVDVRSRRPVDRRWATRQRCPPPIHGERASVQAGTRRQPGCAHLHRLVAWVRRRLGCALGLRRRRRIDRNKRLRFRAWNAFHERKRIILLQWTYNARAGGPLRAAPGRVRVARAALSAWSVCGAVRV